MIFGRRLLDLRRERGLTQERLAERSNLSVDAIRRIERGRLSPTLKTIEKLSSGLEVAVPAFFGEEPQPKSELLESLRTLLSARNEAELARVWRIIQALFEPTTPPGRDGAAGPEPRNRIGPATVLVIDDDARDRRTLCELFVDDALECLHFKSIPAALRSVRDPVDLLLVDLEQVDGAGRVEALQQMLAQSVLAGTPLVVIAPQASADFVLPGGARGVLHKPFDRGEVRALVSHTLAA